MTVFPENIKVRRPTMDDVSAVLNLMLARDHAEYGERILILPSGSWHMKERHLLEFACANTGSGLALSVPSPSVFHGDERVWAWRYYAIALPSFTGVERA